MTQNTNRTVTSQSGQAHEQGTCLVAVIGMHRAGTSALARALQALGVELGDDLMPPVKDNNPKGFFEDRGINQLNIRLLRHVGRDWDSLSPTCDHEALSRQLASFKVEAVRLLRSKLAKHATFGMKDPRLTRLMPFWEEIFRASASRHVIVIALRNPMAVAESLFRRDGFDHIKSYYLWLVHMLDAWKAVRASTTPVVVVNYDRLLQTPLLELARLARTIGVDISERAIELDRYASEFLDPELCHAQFSPTDLALDPVMPSSVKHVFNAFLEAAEDDFRIADDVLEREYECMIEHSGVLELSSRFDRENRRAHGQLATLEAEHRRVLERVQDLEMEIRDGKIAAEASAECSESLASRLLERAVASHAKLSDSHERELRHEEMLDRLRQERDSLASRARECDARIEEQQQQIQSLLHREDELSADVRRLSIERSKEQTIAAGLRVEMDRFRDEGAVLRESRDNYVREMVELAKQLLSLQDQQSRHIRDRAELIDQFRKVAPAQTTFGKVLNRMIRPAALMIAAGLNRSARRWWMDRRLIARSSLFDANWYVQTYPDVLVSRMDPLDHFTRFGSLEQRSPGPAFDTTRYLRDNPDVASAGINALAHFERHGRKEGRVAVPHTRTP